MIGVKHCAGKGSDHSLANTNLYYMKDHYNHLYNHEIRVPHLYSLGVISDFYYKQQESFIPTYWTLKIYDQDDLQQSWILYTRIKLHHYQAVPPCSRNSISARTCLILSSALPSIGISTASGDTCGKTFLHTKFSIRSLASFFSSNGAYLFHQVMSASTSLFSLGSSSRS